MEHFSTQNRQLAFALLSAGCALAPQKNADDEDTGGPAINLYTVAFLRGRGIGVGKPLEQAAQIAVDRKVPGIVTYLFQRTDKLGACIKAWDGMVQEFMNADAAQREPVLPEVSDEDVMRVLYVYAQNQDKFGQIPWFTTPLVGDIRTETKEGQGEGGNKTITKGSGKIWSLGASRELKQRLHV